MDVRRELRGNGTTFGVRTNLLRERNSRIRYQIDRFREIEDDYRAAGVRYHSVELAVRSGLTMLGQNTHAPPLAAMLTRLAQAFEVPQGQSSDLPETENFQDASTNSYWPYLEQGLATFDPNAGLEAVPTTTGITIAMPVVRGEMDQQRADVNTLCTMALNLQQAGLSRSNTLEETNLQTHQAVWWMVIRLPEVRRAMRNGMALVEATHMTFGHDGVLEPSMVGPAPQFNQGQVQAQQPEGHVEADADNAAAHDDDDNWPYGPDAALVRIRAQFEQRQRQRDMSERQQ